MNNLAHSSTSLSFPAWAASININNGTVVSKNESETWSTTARRNWRKGHLNVVKPLFIKILTTTKKKIATEFQISLLPVLWVLVSCYTSFLMLDLKSRQEWLSSSPWPAGEKEKSKNHPPSVCAVPPFLEYRWWTYRNSHEEKDRTCVTCTICNFPAFNAGWVYVLGAIQDVFWFTCRFWFLFLI